MNTKKKAIYTMIGGLLIKNVPHYAKKIKILSNGSIIAVEKSGNESFIYSPSQSINHDYDKYSFVVFDVPPLAPVFEVGSALGFDSFGEQVLPAEGVQFYGRGNRVKPANAEIPKVSTESLDVTEIQHENKNSINILNLTFYDGEKLSNILKMVESEIAKSGINVYYDYVNNHEAACINTNDAESLINLFRSKLAIASDNLSNQLLNNECDDLLINETMCEIHKLRKSIKMLSEHKRFIIKPVIV
nr:MAG TPA: hypothetical protein [Caudoviricetes sp.]